MNLIVAVDSEFGIGKNGTLLTHLPEDLKRFKRMTMGKILIMGRKTIDSLPGQKLLPGRETWILSQNKLYTKEGAKVFTSAADIFQHMATHHIDSSQVFVCGGAMIYSMFLPFCQKAYVTKIQSNLHADTYMSNLDDYPEMVLSHVSSTMSKDETYYTFVEYSRC